MSEAWCPYHQTFTEKTPCAERLEMAAEVLAHLGIEVHWGQLQREADLAYLARWNALDSASTADEPDLTEKKP